jgi:peptidoglycan hydrolase-like protein with peptidoglycan-binding domain
MLLKVFSIAGETAVWRASTRSLAVMACVASLAGCENFSEFESGLRERFSETFKQSSESAELTAKSDPVPYHDDASANEVIVSLDRPAARTLQAQLAKLGFRPGPVDGIVGKKTAKAIKRYQAAHDLPVTGKISLQLMEHLEETSVRGKKEARSRVNLASDDFPTYLPGTSFLGCGATVRVTALIATFYCQDHIGYRMANEGQQRFPARLTSFGRSARDPKYCFRQK